MNWIEFTIDVLGWIGAALLLLAYAFVSNGKLSGHDRAYQAMNVLGSILLIINSTYYGALPSVGVNVVWIFIGLAALRKGLRSRATSS